MTDDWTGTEEIDYGTIKFEINVYEYLWLYLNPAEKGYKCKKCCEQFHATEIANIKEAYKSLSDNPRSLL